jgi:hypothetical protein
LLSNFRGAGKAEMIPYEPDAGNAAEGKSRNILPYFSIPEVHLNFIRNGNHFQQ